MPPPDDQPPRQREQLSLQASIGVYFEYRNASVGESNTSPPAPAGGRDEIAFGTTVMGEPWDIFLGSLSALYYF